MIKRRSQKCTYPSNWGNKIISKSVSKVTSQTIHKRRISICLHLAMYHRRLGNSFGSSTWRRTTKTLKSFRGSPSTRPASNLSWPWSKPSSRRFKPQKTVSSASLTSRKITLRGARRRWKWGSIRQKGKALLGILSIRHHIRFSLTSRKISFFTKTRKWQLWVSQESLASSGEVSRVNKSWFTMRWRTVRDRIPFPT